MNKVLIKPDHSSLKDIQARHQKLLAAQKDAREIKDQEHEHRAINMEREFNASLPIFTTIFEMNFPGNVTTNFDGDTLDTGGNALIAAAGAAIGSPIAIPFFIANGASPLWSIPLLLLSGIGLYVLVSGTPRFLNLKRIWHLAKESSGEDKPYTISRLIALSHDINIDVTITEHQNGNVYSGAIVCKYKKYRVEIPVDLAIPQGTAVEEALSAAQALKEKLTAAISSESELVKMLKDEKPLIDKEFEYTVQV
jgi:hypothetical protein